MIVVSDTSPIRALVHLGLLDLLPHMFDRVLVPPAVVAELEHPASRYSAIAVTTLTFAEVRIPTNSRIVQELLLTLDLGEAEAIALAIELNVVC